YDQPTLDVHDKTVTDLRTHLLRSIPESTRYANPVSLRKPPRAEPHGDRPGQLLPIIRARADYRRQGPGGLRARLEEGEAGGHPPYGGGRRDRDAQSAGRVDGARRAHHRTGVGT